MRYACLASGLQAVSKGRQGSEAANTVSIVMAVIRLPAAASDMLVTLNSPVIISPGSAAAEHAGAGVKRAFATAPQLLQAALDTLSIHDWGLFGQGASEPAAA